ncbi:hypothetical protein J4414_01025 [Candidatus Woesearchaeota archaeon]|nr:hypothetical protein [Candidatus Woesearchaeota archaeon]
MSNKYEIKRKLYRRGSSYEITIPKAILWNIDLSRKYSVIFNQKKKQWYIKLDEFGKDRKTGIVRRLYKRGSSYETTLPIQLLFNLDLSKKYNVIFTLDKEWYIKLEEI